MDATNRIQVLVHLELVAGGMAGSRSLFHAVQQNKRQQRAPSAETEGTWRGTDLCSPGLGPELSPATFQQVRSARQAGAALTASPQDKSQSLSQYEQ